MLAPAPPTVVVVAVVAVVVVVVVVVVVTAVLPISLYLKYLPVFSQPDLTSMMYFPFTALSFLCFTTLPCVSFYCITFSFY